MLIVLNLKDKSKNMMARVSTILNRLKKKAWLQKLLINIDRSQSDNNKKSKVENSDMLTLEIDNIAIKNDPIKENVSFWKNTPSKKEKIHKPKKSGIFPKIEINIKAKKLNEFTS